MVTSATSQPFGYIGFDLFSELAAPAPYTLPIGAYHVRDSLAYLLRFQALAQSLGAEADSGTVTITKSDSIHLDGRIDVAMSIGSPPYPPGPDFHLTGGFRLVRVPSVQTSLRMDPPGGGRRPFHERHDRMMDGAVP
jgi:hypothetical protein